MSDEQPAGEPQEDEAVAVDAEALHPDVDFESLARAGADAAESKKATDVMILDLGQQSPVCDYFVLASGKTRLQTRAIANAIDERLKASPVQRRRQGYRTGGWILLDYGNVVFHVFLDREREYYDLEGLWSQAKVIYQAEVSTH